MAQKKDEFYQWFKLLLAVLIILNVLDSFTTMIGIYAIDGVSEGNVVVALFTSNLATFVIIKIGILSAFLIGALAYLFKIHHSFPKLWENEVGIGVASLVVAFYLFVVVNNIVVITSVL